MNVRKTIGSALPLLVLAFASGGASALAGPTSSKEITASPPAQALPPALRPVLYQALAKDAGPIYAINEAGCATLSREKLTACFNGSGARFSSARSPLTLYLAAYGRHNNLTIAKRMKPLIRGNEASYAHGDLIEWWRVLPMGFEQGFTITKRPAGRGELRLTLVTNMRSSRHGDTLGWGKLRYGKLVVTDARGKIVPATLNAQGKRVLIAVNDAHAHYPLTVDPLVWQEQEVTASDGSAYDQFGFSAAVSGATALIGAPAATVSNTQWAGAVYVFTQSNGVWSETQKLAANDPTKMGSFGWSVALDGTTAIIGASGLLGATDAEPGDYGAQGAAYIFSDTSGTWTQVQKLTASDGFFYDAFGWAVAVNGTTALVSAIPNMYYAAATPGRVYVFTESNGTWTQTRELFANDSQPDNGFGNSIAFDGTTALIGAPLADIGDNPNQGAAYVFAQTNGSWAQVQELTAGDGESDDLFGESVAFADNNALIGAAYAGVNGNSQQGAVYAFTQSNGTWTQTQKFTASDGAAGEFFGSSIALAGTTALIGAPLADVGANVRQGAAYLFNDTNGTWTQTQKFVAVDGAYNSYFGWSTALAGDGATGLVGASHAPVGGTVGQGAAYFETAGGCPAGYTTYTGTLAANKGTRSPSYEAPAGVENAILYAPAGFKLYARLDNSEWGSQRQQGFSGTEVHRWGPTGIYSWGVKAGATGGAFTFCLLHP